MTTNYFKLATPGVQGLQPYQPGKPVSELEREYGIKNAIKLASNENPLGPSPRAIKAIQPYLNTLARYPDGNGFILKHALAKKLGVELEMITLGNGSNDIIELVARAFVTPNDSVIFSQHAFAVYPLITQAIGAQAIVTPAKDWGHDLTAMQAAICDHTRVIFVANPNNPTGTWVDKTTLKTFLEAVPDNVIILVDEAYFEYAIEMSDYPDSLQWMASHPNLIVTRTFSKAYGLAGLRVGYAISHPDLANLLNRIRQPFNVNTPALVAAVAALEDQDYLNQSVTVNREGMLQLAQAFDELKLPYITSAGNFITVEVGDGDKVYNDLLFEGMITRPVGGGYQMPKHLRVSVGLDEENFLFIEALKKVLNRQL